MRPEVNWVEWVTAICRKTAYDSNGSVKISRIFLSQTQQEDVMKAFLADKGKGCWALLIRDNEDRDKDGIPFKATVHCCGIPLYFADRLPKGKFLLRLEGVGDDRVASPSGPTGEDRKTS